MAGEVVDMFGSGNRGPFGTSGFGNVSGADEAVEPGPAQPPGPDPRPAGDSQPEMKPQAALIQELNTALDHARQAAHRLIELVPPAAMPEEQFDQLHNTYAVLQANLGVVAQQVQIADSSDALLAANRDTREVVVQVQQYIEAVESAINQLGSAQQPDAQLAPRTAGGSNTMLWVALAVGVAAAGYGVWQIQKRRKGAKKK